MFEYDWRHGLAGPEWSAAASDSCDSSLEYGQWSRLDSTSSDLSSIDHGSPRRGQRQISTSSADRGQDHVGPLVGFTRQHSECSHGTSLASSSQHYADPAQTLIFLDWDDTLFPTTEIFENWGMPRKPKEWWTSPLPPQLEIKLQPWREAVHQYLSVACSLSDHCAIVTSSRSPWVERCIERFAPNLQQIFAREKGGPRVVYAEKVPACHKTLPSKGKHDNIPKTSAKTLTAGKLAAMKREAQRFYSSYPEQTWKNILSLGDMKYEHDALHELALSRRSMTKECLRTKAILLPRGASLSELTLRLQFSRLMLPAYVRFNGNIDLDLRSAPDPLQAIAESLHMPELGSLPFPRHAWGRTPVPEDNVAAEALAEVAVTVHDSLVQEAFTHQVKVPTFVVGAKTFVSTESHRSNRSPREANPSANPLTLEAFVCGIAAGAAISVIVFCVTLALSGSSLLAAEQVVDFGFGAYMFIGSSLALSTLHWSYDPCVYDKHATPTRSALEAGQAYLIRPWAERAANIFCRQSLGYRWADSMYVCLLLATGQHPDSWAKRLVHYVVQSVANVCCLAPGAGARVRCCLICIAYLSEASLCLASLLWWTFELQAGPWSWLPRLLFCWSRFVSCMWFVYLASALRRRHAGCTLQVQLVMAGCAHLLGCSCAVRNLHFPTPGNPWLRR